MKEIEIKLDEKFLRKFFKITGVEIGEDEEIDTKYEECMKLTPVLDEN